ncbi:MAG: response regulator [Scytolyngbya sp. HA4215-MV1]|jgi:signal transduction histidine kinase/DNA-binding response OmpR family regulator|nr:response regulator [Scytolyngbya sp. HA4215-MV1]
MSTVWTLLITDDCAEDREIYREYLSSDPEQSYQILEAASAEVGLELYQKKRCDAILLDFSLPDMSGLEFLDELRHQGWDEPLPVIMLTGQGNESVAVQAMKRGAQDYLVKQHLQPDILQVTVRNVIQQSHLQKPRQKSAHSPQPCLYQATPTQRKNDLAQVALRIRESLDLQRVLQTAATEIHQLLNCDRTVIYRLAPNAEISQLNLLSPDDLQKCYEVGSNCSTEPLQGFLTCLSDGFEPSSVAQSLRHFADRNGTVSSKQEQATILTVRDRQTDPVAYLIAPILTGHLPQLVVPPSRQAEGSAIEFVGNIPEADVKSLWGLLVAEPGASHRQWQTDEVEMLEQLADHLAIAIQQTEQFTQALAILETERQLNAFKTQFVATVSREYRAPLASILAAASTLKQHGKQLDSTKYQRFLQLIEEKARQMSLLVEELLVLETFESGKAAFTPLPFEVLQFFSDIIEEQRQLLSDRTPVDSAVHHELIFKISGNTRNFRGDQHLLRQILINLLSNAIKFSPLGGNIEVHLMGTESHLQFEVKDQGIGMALAEQTTLFQAFNRGSNVSAIVGHGLGLAIVKLCVDLHDGEVAIQSQPGRGTTVIVTLPKNRA